MANPLTLEVESRMGIVFVFLIALFFAGILFTVIKNFSSDQIVLDASTTQIKTITSTERQLIAQWVNSNSIELPDGEGYRYFVQQYPNRPWLSY